MNPQHTLREFPKDELQTFNLALQAFLDEHDAHLVTRPVISDDGRIDSRILAYKKVELIPKEDGASEKQNQNENGEKNNNESPVEDKN